MCPLTCSLGGANTPHNGAAPARRGERAAPYVNYAAFVAIGLRGPAWRGV